MSFLHSPVGGFDYYTSSVAGSRPSPTTWGDQLTPGQNSFPTPTEILSTSEVAQDLYGLYIAINSVAVTNTARDCLVTIGVDPAGGTAWVTRIDNLICSCAGNMTSIGGQYHYYFPLFIPAGSSICAAFSVNNATVGTANIYMIGYGKPASPDITRTGTYVVTIGANTATSAGTAVTPGTTSDGTWTSLGTTSVDTWFWDVGMGINDATLNNQGPTRVSLAYDIGGSGNRVIIIEDMVFVTGSSETIGKNFFGVQKFVPSGATIYGRLQHSGNLDSNYSLAAYGVAV